MQPKSIIKIVSSLLFSLFFSCTSVDVFVKDADELKIINNLTVLPISCSNVEVGRSISDSIAANLLKSRFEIIERSQLERILKEWEISLSDIAENHRLIVGKIKNVDAIIVGSAKTSQGFAGLLYGGYIEYVSSCTVKMIEIETGKIIIAATFSSESASTMRGVTTASEVGKMLAEEIIKSLR